MIPDPLGELDPVRRVGRMRRAGLSIATIAARVDATEDEIRRLVAEAAERQFRGENTRPATYRPGTFAAPVSPCQHCSRREATPARGLCRRCDYTPAVRASYPARRPKYSRRGVGNGCGNRPPPPWPTVAPPGSAAKVEVLSQRAAGGFQLHHPADAGFDGPPLGLSTDMEFGQ